MVDPEANHPIRVLHVFKHITGGGVESWLFQVLQHADRVRFQMDIAVRDNERGPFDARFEASGARVFHFSRPPTRLTYAAPFRSLLESAEPYDVVHCHSVFNRGFVLKLSRSAGVPLCIAHSHNAPPLSSSALRKFRVALRARALAGLWDRGIACSIPAGDELFGETWRENPKVKLLYCGIDMEPFRAEPNRSVREELGIPAGAFVVGHVGRFNEQKNHVFLVSIAERVLARCPEAWFVLIGDGELREETTEAVRKRGMTERFTIMPRRDDIPQLMVSAMDVFVLPSLHEGLPLVGMEAQAASLPMVISDVITPEMDSVPDLITRLSLNQSADEWADSILACRAVDRAAARPTALKAMEESPFNIVNSVESLLSLYESSLAEVRRDRLS